MCAYFAIKLADFWVIEVFGHVDFESSIEIFVRRLLKGVQGDECLFHDEAC